MRWHPPYAAIQCTKLYVSWRYINYKKCFFWKDISSFPIMISGGKVPFVSVRLLSKGLKMTKEGSTWMNENPYLWDLYINYRMYNDSFEIAIANITMDHQIFRIWHIDFSSIGMSKFHDKSILTLGHNDCIITDSTNSINSSNFPFLTYGHILARLLQSHHINHFY